LRHHRREFLPVAVDALRKLLQDFNGRTGARMSAIVSRSGVPVAWVLPDDAQVDNFATMAATLLGALEVIYATMKVHAPSHVAVESDGGVLSIREVTAKMFFVAMVQKRSPALGKAVEELLTKAKGLLG
jgi:predicted regulator of Ras-like GTPase activity (Roadblock/LC7/MglB family)